MSYSAYCSGILFAVFFYPLGRTRSARLGDTRWEERGVVVDEAVAWCCRSRGDLITDIATGC